jgi:hypothetical protein
MYIIEKNYEMIARFIKMCWDMEVSVRSVVYTYSTSNKKAEAVLKWIRQPEAKTLTRLDFKHVFYATTKHYVERMPKPNPRLPKRTRIMFEKIELIKRVRKVKDRLQIKKNAVQVMMIPCASVIKKEKNREVILTRIFNGFPRLSDEKVIECMEAYADYVEKQRHLYGKD